MNIKNILRVLFVLILLFAFVSCAFLPPVDLAQESPISPVTEEIISPHWQPLNDVTGAVSFFNGNIDSPRIEFWALRVDMSAPELRIVVRGGAPSGENARHTFSARVSSFVRDNGLLAGINAVPFDISSAEEGIRITNVGIVVSDGVVIAPANPHFDALVWYDDGTVSIVNQEELRSAENIQNAVGGFHQILKANELTERVAGREARHARSAAGICADGKYLYLLVIDGRRMGSIGSTEAETAMLLRALGSWDGINFDGGGSSSMAVRGNDGNVSVVNNPVHGGIPGRERAVAGSLGIELILPNDNF